jgi:hypothetical protein
VISIYLSIYLSSLSPSSLLVIPKFLSYNPQAVSISATPTIVLKPYCSWDMQRLLPTTASLPESSVVTSYELKPRYSHKATGRMDKSLLLLLQLHQQICSHVLQMITLRTCYCQTLRFNSMVSLKERVLSILCLQSTLS